MSRRNFVKLAACAGLLGPILFGAALIALTLAQYDFMLTLGWHPLHAPTLDWPSGLALGPLGRLMTAAFLLNGAAMVWFASGLCAALGKGRRLRAAPRGPLLMIFAGLAMMGLAFTTDPTIRSTPATWHGRLHDLSFVLLGLSLMPALIILGFDFRQDAGWKDLSACTWGSALLALPAFFIKGAAFYVFLFVMLLWSEMAAMRLKRMAPNSC